MFAEINVVVRGNNGDGRSATSGPVVNALAGMAPGACASNDRGR